MLVSRSWLQNYFDTPLPPVEEIAEALTFHAFEVEEIKNDTLDVNVLPDRACYALSHRGIAYEVAAALGLKLASDPLAEAPVLPAQTAALEVTVCDSQLVPRYMGAVVRGVEVGPSPQWLVERLGELGHRSINNVVDATNFVMLNIGQPLHAFDAAKLGQKEGRYGITVRQAYEGETITALSDDSYILPEGTLLIVDATKDAAIGIAGVMGGKDSGVTEGTTDLVIESANFDPTYVRRAAQALKLFTDASLRFQNRPSPELAAYGMSAVLELITKVASGTVEGVVDRYAAPRAPQGIRVEYARMNAVLGTDFSTGDIDGALDRLLLPHEGNGDVFTVSVPFWRGDLVRPEDFAEEIGRTLGYDKVPVTQLPPIGEADQRAYRGIERIKDVLLERGYVEISTPSFAAEGEIELANPLQTDRPFLRAELVGNMRDALARAKNVAPRVLGPDSALKLFELGTVFTKSGEHLSLALGYEALSGKPHPSMLTEDLDAVCAAVADLPEAGPRDGIAEVSLADVNLEKAGDGYECRSITLGAYRPYSVYPFALRDIAVWTPEGTEETEVSLLIQKEAGDFLARMDLFDRFEKDGRISYAFRLVFESMDRTLSDTDLDPLMARITDALNAQNGWEVR